MASKKFWTAPTIIDESPAGEAIATLEWDKRQASQDAWECADWGDHRGMEEAFAEEAAIEAKIDWIEERMIDASPTAWMMANMGEMA